jgi:predicted DNA-binding transcriptional regulator YafY
MDGRVNRTDRLYALVEELRAFAPRPRTAHQLAGRFEVSIRTIERDINALLQSGVPLYATPGPGGGYALDKAHTLPPVNFTPEEAAALAVTLARPGDAPLADALRSAIRKVIGVMPERDAETARRLAGRIHLFPHASDDRRATARVIEEAILRSLVVEIDYEDQHGAATSRLVEPLALAGSGEAWYLVGYCRLRKDERVFRLDRIGGARLTGETAPDNREPAMQGAPKGRRLSLLD